MLTTAQVEALAPDASSLKAGRQLAEARKWSGLGQDARSLWGLCQGSGKDPYQAQVDLSEPAFRCSCPSRKFPCKHGLGLMLLWTQQPAALAQGQAPGWVGDWLAGRDQRSSKKQERVDKPPDLEAQARRSAQRQSRVEEGVAFLSSWLADMMRQGLSSVSAFPDSHWQGAAARLIDTQAPGLARMVARIPEILARTPWQSRLLEHLGRLHLLLTAFARSDLSPQLQAEVRSRIGWTQNQEELLARPGLRDRWWVLGQRAFEDEPVKTLRTWLWGEHSQKPALLLDFAAGGRPLARTHSVGSVLEGELVYFDGAWPLRALPKSLTLAVPGKPPAGHSTFDDFLSECAGILAVNPWVEEFPTLLQAVVPGASGQYLVDSQGHSVPLQSIHYWRLAAISGGHPISLFGEWDGHALRPLTLWSGERLWTH
ncbi:SWIM zinc finger family protein [bacterium]|nr:SWIM zinc finger family protein [bacterium]